MDQYCAPSLMLSTFSKSMLQSLLDEPNPNSPANSLAAQLYQENKREYEKRVATVVEQSWLNLEGIPEEQRDESS